MSAKAKPQPLNRLTQTLRTIRYTRSIKQAPLAKWEVLLILANTTQPNGRPKPMSTDELAFEMGIAGPSVPVLALHEEGLVCVDRKSGVNTYTLSLKGEEEAVRIINGVTTNSQTNAQQPDMAKVSAYVGGIPKYT